MEWEQFYHLCVKIINDYEKRKTIVLRRLRRRVGPLVECPFNIHSIVEQLHLCSTQYKLEREFFALDSVLLIVSYIYISCATNIYETIFTTRQYSIKMIRTVFPNESDEFINTLVSIHEALYKTPSYKIYIPGVIYSLPWNYCVLPKIMWYNKRLQLKKIPKTVKPILEFESVYTKLEIYALFLHFSHLMPDYITDREAINNFLTNTLPVAPMVNGTACVGKSTILAEVIEYLDKTGIEHNGIIKGSKHGGFTGKDVNQILALQHQFSTLHMTFTNPIAIQDRDPFNNLWWRIIQALLGVSDENEMFDMFWELIKHISPIVIDRMMKYPVIILVDSFIEENRKRMKTRATGGDLIRSSIGQYVRVQNVVYGIMATLCKWPIFNSPIYSISTKTEIINLIIKKIEQNQLSCKIKNEKSPPEIYTFKAPTDFNEDAAYMAARLLEIMK